MADQMLPHPIPTTMRVIMATGEAMRLKFRIEPCAKCGGPEVFSKTTATSRCLRCGQQNEHMAVKQHKVSWRRCKLCEKPNMAGVPLTSKWCRECGSLSSGQRAKKMRWKAERVADANKPLQNDTVNIGDSSQEQAEVREVATANPKTTKNGQK